MYVQYLNVSGLSSVYTVTFFSIFSFNYFYQIINYMCIKRAATSFLVCHIGYTEYNRQCLVMANFLEFLTYELSFALWCER